MKVLEQLYEGKAKKVFKTDDDSLYLIRFKDDATAFNGEKKGSIADKGIMNNEITTLLFEELRKAGIEHHLVEKLNEREQLVKVVKIIPLEVIVRNIAAGSFAKRYGVKEGTLLKKPTLEFCYKNDDLGDPMLNETHIVALDLASEEDIRFISEQTIKINEVLKGIFQKCNLTLVDFKIEFGWTPDGKIILADEISPDCCRLWDATTNEKMDKDRFRRDLGNVEEAYQTVLERLQNALA
jgi:phosphoribosylaminoimidazole-succinocarboxamide synthase